MLRYVTPALLLALTGAAHAESGNIEHPVSFAAGQSYAIRSLCPLRGEVHIVVATPIGADVVKQSGSDCVFGRIGLTFTAPSDGPPVQHYLVSVQSAVPVRNTRLAIEDDCAGGRETACSAGVPGTVAGKITFPGDQDWVRLPRGGVNIAPKTTPGCFVSASVVDEPTGVFAIFVGGPSGCDYSAIIRPRVIVASPPPPPPPPPLPAAAAATPAAYTY